MSPIYSKKFQKKIINKYHRKGEKEGERGRRRRGSKAARTAYANALQWLEGEWSREEVGRKGVGKEKRLQKPAKDKSPLSGEVGREVCLHCNGKRREATGGLLIWWIYNLKEDHTCYWLGGGWEHKFNYFSPLSLPASQIQVCSGSLPLSHTLQQLGELFSNRTLTGSLSRNFAMASHCPWPARTCR